MLHLSLLRLTQRTYRTYLSTFIQLHIFCTGEDVNVNRLPRAVGLAFAFYSFQAAVVWLSESLWSESRGGVRDGR